MLLSGLMVVVQLIIQIRQDFNLPELLKFNLTCSSDHLLELDRTDASEQKVN